MNFSKGKPTSVGDSLRDFLKTLHHATKCIKIPLPKPKVEIGSTKSKDNLFVHYYTDIIEHPNTQVRLTFRFGKEKPCEFSLKKFELPGNQFTLTKVVNLKHCEIHHLHKKGKYVANKCEINASNYDV